MKPSLRYQTLKLLFLSPNMKNSRLSPCLAALLVAHLPWQTAQAATGTWTGAGGATWDTSDTHWTGVSGTPWDSTNGPTNTALFSSAATPTVSGTVYANTITIDALTTITGGTITLAGSSPTINGSNNEINIIYSVLAGTNGLTKSGTGTVYLDPGNGWWENTFSGNITINGGNLASVRSTSLGDGAGTITINTSGILNVDWSTVTRTGLVTVNGGTLRTQGGSPQLINNGAGFVLENAGAITTSLAGSGGLTVNGARSYLWSANTYTGPTVIAAGGDLALSGGGALPTNTALDLLGNFIAGNGNHTVGGLTGNGTTGRLISAAGKTFTVNKVSGTDSYGGTIEAMTTFIKDGAGTLSLTNANNNISFPGALTVNNGVLELGGAGRFNAGSYSGAVSLSSSSSVLQIATSANQTLAGTIDGSGSLTKSGAGTLTVSGSNSYSGGTTVDGGTLTASHANALGDAASAVMVSGGASLYVNANMTRTGTVTIDAAALVGSAVTLTNNGGDIEVKNGSSIAGSVALAGSGGVTVTGARSYWYSSGHTYTGPTVIAVGGDLALSGGGALPTTTAVDLSGVLIANTGNATVGGLTGASTGRLIGGAYTFTVNKTSGTDSYGGTIESMTTFIKDGAGTLSLTHPNNNSNFPGALTVSNGVLELGEAGRLAAGSYSGAVSLSSASSVLQIATSANQTLAGTIDGSGSLTKSGAGTLTLSGSNSYAGGTTVDGGTLTASHANALGDAAGAVTVNSGGTLNVNANMTRTGTVTVNGGDLGTGNGSTLTINGGGFVLTGSYASAGGVVLAGSSGLTASSADARLWAQATYSGATTVNSGTLRICGSGGIPTTSAVSIASGAAVNLTSYFAPGGPDGDPLGGNRTIGGLTGAGVLYGNTGTVTVNKTSGSDTFSGSVQGSQGFIKDGAGTLELTGSNTYTGATTVAAGTLAFGANNVLPDASAVALGAATLDAGTRTDTLGTLDVTAAATIHLGTGAAIAFADSSAIDWTGGSLNLTGTFVSGTSLRFGTTNAGLTATQLGMITATGFTGFALNAGGYLTATPAGGYTAWQSANGTTGTLDQDHDNDGVPNGVEYFLMGTANSTGFTALPPVDNSGGTLSVTWTKAAGYSGSYGTDFRVETSTTLANPWTPATEGVGPGFVEIIGNNVKYTFPTGPVRSFARLVVTGP
jgi:fibronectin-binding autotransporter adhesin